MPEETENNKCAGEFYLEFKRRKKKIGAFPSEQSLLRLVVTIMMDVNEEWITGRRYINMEEN